MKHSDMSSTEFYARKAELDRVQRNIDHANKVAAKKAAEATTADQLRAGLAALRAIADTVRELGQIPSGHLYAQVMTYFSLEGYEKAIGLLCNSGVIRKDGDMLRWNL